MTEETETHEFSGDEGNTSSDADSAARIPPSTSYIGPFEGPFEGLPGMPGDLKFDGRQTWTCIGDGHWMVFT